MDGKKYIGMDVHNEIGLFSLRILRLRNCQLLESSQDGDDVS
jgi:hypothetical protein